MVSTFSEISHQYISMMNYVLLEAGGRLCVIVSAVYSLHFGVTYMLVNRELWAGES